MKTHFLLKEENSLVGQQQKWLTVSSVVGQKESRHG